MRVPGRKVPDDVSSNTRDANERFSGRDFLPLLLFAKRVSL